MAVLDDIIDTATTRTLEAIAAAPDDASARIRAAVETMVHQVTDDPRRARVLFVEAYGNEATMKRRNAAVRTLAELAAGLAPTVADVTAVSEYVVDSIALVLTGGIGELVIAWLEGRPSMSRDDLIDICVELMVTTSQNVGAMAERLAEARQRRAH